MPYLALKFLEHILWSTFPYKFESNLSCDYPNMVYESYHPYLSIFLVDSDDDNDEYDDGDVL